ncbi:sulfatase-like hydrolase/transferase [Reichenbachiella versicolor]|uniref:sulfatase-like hydrolase/transferase n=1 Tax=Reichenbachiella versicolor TaxID=1821036 RepID=UPI0013A55331|nr:sulfatase-like hydrolase/transferase [Reichenbachiella versicolor]
MRNTMFVFLFLASISTLAKKRPNIILLMADDMSPRELPIYGNKIAKTPHLDLLAQNGVFFKTAWATPKNQATLAMLMTGKYAHQTEWYHGSMRPSIEEKNHHLHEHKLFSNVAKEAGYKTLMAGKFQLNGKVTDHGFDEYFITGDWHGPEGFGQYVTKKGKTKPSCYWNPYVSIYKHEEDTAEWLQTTDNDFGPEMVLRYSMDFIRRAHREDKPFLLYMPLHLGNRNGNNNLPKTPQYSFFPRRTYIYSDNSMAAHANYIDMMIGQLKLQLHKIKELENTIFIITSDNASEDFGKESVSLEKGTRVPLIISGAGVKAIGRSDALTDLTDIFPTIEELVGAKLSQNIDGVSLVPVLHGKHKTHREWIYSYMTVHQMVRTKDILKDGYNMYWHQMDHGPYKLISGNSVEFADQIAIIKKVLKEIPAPSRQDSLYLRYMTKIKDKKSKDGPYMSNTPK